MKKIILSSIIFLSFIFLTWCVRHSETTSGYNEMIELYNNEWNITCTISSIDNTDWSFNWTMYLDQKNIYFNQYLYTEDEWNHLYILSIDDKTYIRWDSYWEWYGIIKESISVIPNLLQSFQEEQQSFNYECTKGIKWYEFEVPSDIEFVQRN